MRKCTGAPCLWLVVPCYNEEKVLPYTSEMFLKKMQSLISAEAISDESRILFVDDGSKDTTWSLICGLAASDPHFIGIQQSRNRGHQNAVLAGLMEAREYCDVTISLDCDGQDDINAMDRMLEEYAGGCEIVYGVRSDRQTDSYFKRTSAHVFYRFLRFMGAEVVYNHADYRLVSSMVLNHFADFEEVNIFLRGMFPLVGFKSTSVYYARSERIAGESHYPLRKMLSLAFEGITSLSVRPITMIFELGLLISFLSFVGIIWAVVQTFRGATVPGWSSIVCIICFLSGVQLLSLGIIGQYVGKTYLETKHRPRYIISERTGDKFQEQ